MNAVKFAEDIEAELYVAQGVGHSDSSKTAGYPKAVRSFIDRYWQKAG
jgi:hypothetical protein